MDIFIKVEGASNSAGKTPDGAENEAGVPSVEAPIDAAIQHRSGSAAIW